MYDLHDRAKLNGVWTTMTFQNSSGWTREAYVILDARAMVATQPFLITLAWLENADGEVTRVISQGTGGIGVEDYPPRQIDTRQIAALKQTRRAA